MASKRGDCDPTIAWAFLIAMATLVIVGAILSGRISDNTDRIEAIEQQQAKENNS